MTHVLQLTKRTIRVIISQKPTFKRQRQEKLFYNISTAILDIAAGFNSVLTDNFIEIMK